MFCCPLRSSKCCGTAPIAARSFTRDNPILANTRQSSTSRCGMRFRCGSLAIPPSATPAHALTNRACSPGCCSMPRGNRMTPSYAVKEGRRYRYYVSRPLITQDRRESSTALRIPAAEIEHLVTSRVRQWLLDPGGIYQSTRLPDLSAQRRLIACAVEIGKSWTELPGTRQRAFLGTLIDRIDVGAHQIDIHLRPTRLAALLDGAATTLPSASDDKIQILAISVRLRRAGRAIRMLIE